MPEAGTTGERPKATVRVVIEFEPNAEIAGRVRRGETTTEFRGRLELYAAIERARATAKEPETT